MISLNFLFPYYRQRVLDLILLNPQTRYHVREIARLTNTLPGTLHRELSKLAQAQVLLREVQGNQVYYKANTNYPIFSELTSILRKTSSLVNTLELALSSFAGKIEAAFVFGSMASGTENLSSDIDLLIIGEISLSDVVKALYLTQTILKREINPKIFKRAEWKKLKDNKNPFVQDILNKPMIFIIGTIDDIK